jgi:hypothetical protein
MSNEQDKAVLNAIFNPNTPFEITEQQPKPEGSETLSFISFKIYH